MARATTTKTPARKLRAKVEEAPRRKPGRPVGSTNLKRAITSAAKVAKPAVKRATSAKTTKTAKVTKPAKAAAPAPKMSKAELELHVVKLERTIARLREKNKELKVATPKAPAPVEIPAPKAPVTEAKPVRKTRRSAKSAVAVSSTETPPEE